MIKNFTTLLGATALLGALITPVIAQTSETTTMPMQSHEHGDGTTMEMPEGMMGTPIILGDLELSSFFTRAMPPRAISGGGFVTIANSGDVDDRLVSASSTVSEHVELHIMRMDGEVMKMESQPDGFVIPAGETVELKPGGKHIMFIGVQTPFAEGENVKVMLHFEHAGMVELMLHAIPIGASGMEHGSMDHSTMSSDSTSN